MSGPAKSELRQAIGACQDGDWWHGLRRLRELAPPREAQRGLPGYYYSYLGQAIARVEGRKRAGVELCREAVRQQPLQPENYLNLGAVELMRRNRRAAYQAARLGLAIDPEHPQLLELMRRLGERRRPVLPFLDRSHPFNRLLGRIAWRLEHARNGHQQGEDELVPY